MKQKITGQNDEKKYKDKLRIPLLSKEASIFGQRAWIFPRDLQCLVLVLCHCKCSEGESDITRYIATNMHWQHVAAT